MWEKVSNMGKKQYLAKIDQDFLDRLIFTDKDEFIAMMRRGVEKGKKEIISDAIERGLFTEEEYNAKFKDNYNDSYGIDSFSQYIGTVLHIRDTDEDIVFVTLNDNLLRDRDMLEDRFGVKILQVEEIGGDV